METLIELYDSEPIYNVFAQDTLNCRRVVFIGTAAHFKTADKLRKYFAKRGAPELIFKTVSDMDCEEIYNAIQNIITAYPDCMLDLTGGSGEAVFAAGRLSAHSGIPFIKSDIENMCVRGVYNTKNFEARSDGYKINDIIELAGGHVRGFGHFDLSSAYGKVYDYIDIMWKILLDYHDSWYKQVRYFQNVLRGKDGAAFEASRESGGFQCIDDIMTRLHNDGILNTLKLSGSKVSFSFSNTDIKRLICDVGVWLELYVYKTVRECGAFTDAGISVVVDWDGIREEYDVLNEIDVMACRGAKSVFISCKTGPVSVEAVNEINILCSHFGGRYAKAVIVTATSMSRDNLCTYKRAAELDIQIIELEDLLAGDLEQILCSL